MVDEFVISSRQLITQTAPFYRVIFELNKYLISAQRTFRNEIAVRRFPHRIRIAREFRKTRADVSRKADLLEMFPPVLF